LQGKPTGPYGRLYEVTTRVPLLIRHPRGLGAGRRVPDIAQHPDLLPTILQFLDIPVPAGLAGRSLWPAIEGKDSSSRRFAFSGRFARTAGERVVPDAERFDGRAGGDGGGEPITVTSDEWALVCPPGTDGRELYHLQSDPHQDRDVIAENGYVATQMHQAFVEFLAESGATPERIRLYTEPQPPLRVSRDTVLFTVLDQAGLMLAYPTEDEAALSLPYLPAQSVVEVRFGDLAQREPSALVHLHEQYYRAGDVY
ncbi:MAG TPA: sulfatase/phosphatase domain-containing protein, partial [Chloroflexota bacterium]|nr:sulfatase/phosphatase domain-containing protein [Chloroflexota bacterium]